MGSGCGRVASVPASANESCHSKPLPHHPHCFDGQIVGTLFEEECISASWEEDKEVGSSFEKEDFICCDGDIEPIVCSRLSDRRNAICLPSRSYDAISCLATHSQ
eukprot:TRINITY_DN82382_c0_g1_i1.p2 TRINITY_DN82382_c0_g1~~TRINITY_DN82382_c0_g1_i1.p2  ORF type:complete len:105 (-),score=24.82 TRINITY_DN82382_c0_g1_i1:313-627(-)